MWLTLAMAILLCVVVLYGPGFFLARTLSFDTLSSLILAPVFTVPVATILGILLERAGFSCSGLVLAALVFGVCLAAFVIHFAARHFATSAVCLGFDFVENGRVSNTNKQAWAITALYAGIALLVASAMFFTAIHAPDSFARNDDTTAHLSYVRGFLDTGTYSTLHVGAYLSPFDKGSYYPAAWHVVVAIVASFINNSVTIATNAVTFVFVAFVFPLNTYFLLATLFPQNKVAVSLGGLFTLSFCAFPWGFLVFGQLFPNMISFIFVPAVLALVIRVIDAGTAAYRARLFIGTIFGLAAIAFAQPNGIFALGVGTVAYCIGRIFYRPNGEPTQLSPRSRCLGALGILGGACVVWALALHMPFLQDVINSNWTNEVVFSIPEAFATGLLFMFGWREGIQPFLTLLLIIGVAYSCKHRRYLWISVLYALTLIMYTIDVQADSAVKHVFTGFWYTDPYRTGAISVLFALPLVVLGGAVVMQALQKWWEKCSFQSLRSWHTHVPIVLFILVFALCQAFPIHIEFTEEEVLAAGMVRVHDDMDSRYHPERVFTSEERVFIHKVMDEVPEGALVLNVPRDGTCWAYGAEGINLYFRRSSNNGADTVEESELIRTKLCDIVTSQDVRQLVERLNARYVLQLDALTSEKLTTTAFRYEEQDWQGIETIDETTPGFTLIMSEGDMRLFKIDD